MAVTVTKRKDPSTQAERRVIGDCRMVNGTLRQPQNKYVTGGFAFTPAELGFDKIILQVIVGLDKEGKALAVAERISDTEWKLKFFSAIGTELANESETMKEKDVPFIAIGE